MSTRKSNEERMQELDLKMEQLKKQKQALLKREKEKERKERTSRLIQNGALAEKYFHCEQIPAGEFEELLKKIVMIEQVKVLISSRNKDVSTNSDIKKERV